MIGNALAIRRIVPLLLLGAAISSAAPNPRFHVFLAFGQSNMEGAVNNPESQDKVVNQRFLELAAVTCNSGSRSLKQGTWTPAIAPIVRCDTKISVVDWFGRTMADSLPSTDTVGLVVVAVGGTKIEGFDLDKYKAYYAAQAS
ncbi:MAG TPA: sialate O-acetylesterase, partial [Fibrobacteria bacterium]|nr:sialate O-acetylesterase [Fibrobacteria bacterium]